MPIKNIVEYCLSQYDRTDKCRDCPNIDCKGSCTDCLVDIFFYNKTRTYNCPNIVSCYVCRYIYKYSSEIEHLLDRLAINDLKEFNVLSLGCGPCTDLFGFYQNLQKHNSELELTYLGIDKNPKWSNIQDKIKEIFDPIPNTSVHFLTANLFNVFETIQIKQNSWRPNFLILQYVLSDILLHNEDISTFIRSLIEKVINKMPDNSYIIINDLNLGQDNTQPRWFYDFISSRVQEKNEIHVSKYHFKTDKKYIKFGSEHKSNGITSQILKEVFNFNPWSNCTSAQIVIKKIASK